tara:strand:+ start:291 stop:629 length:339 start_codon:yes stop_codon:yes gene_type:complete
MNILQITKQFYDATGNNMFADISTYSANGYVFITPSSLLLVKPVRTDSQYHPDSQWKVIAPNAWYVRTAVGENSIKEFISRTPYPLPFIGWMRELKKKPIKWYDFNRIIRRK